MLLNTLQALPTTLLIGVLISLIVAGVLKGLIGVGMPIIAIPLLSFFIDLPPAVSLLSMPLLISNIPQAFEGGNTLKVLKGLAPIFAGAVPGLFAGVYLLLMLNPTVEKALAGSILIAIACITLVVPRFVIPNRAAQPIGVTVGLVAGVIGGIAAMPGPLVFTYLVAKGSRGREFTKEASIFVAVSSLLLGIALSSNHAFSWFDLVISILAVAPVAVGMLLGQKVRDAISPQLFKTLVLVSVIIAGGDLLRRAFI